MEKLSLLVAVLAFVVTSQMTSADKSSLAAADEEESPAYVHVDGFRRPLVSEDQHGDDPAASKRKWGNNKARMWGKRNDDDDDAVEKRKWGEKTSRLWGKRMDMDELTRLLHDRVVVPSERELHDKRKWAKNRARMWGK